LLLLGDDVPPLILLKGWVYHEGFCRF